VARSFCELLDHGDSVRNLIFLGTPSCGTDLANPKNWGTFADLLVNMTGVDGAELFGKLAGLLAQLSLGNFLASVPGLLAQSPEAAFEPGSFLNRLQNSKANRQQVRYGVVCAEFEPTALVPNLKSIATAAALTTADAGLDAVFKSANDLVVNTRTRGVSRFRRLTSGRFPHSSPAIESSSTSRRARISSHPMGHELRRRWACTIATSSHSRRSRRL
jgi:hypothetical protein